MKMMLVIALAVAALGGCVVVPAGPDYGYGYRHDGYGYSYPYGPPGYPYRYRYPSRYYWRQTP